MKSEGVRSIIRRKETDPLRTHERQILTDAEERVLYAALTMLSINNRGLAPAAVPKFVEGGLKKKVSLPWVAGFLRRHPSLKTKRAVITPESRTRSELMPVVDKWIEAMSKFRQGKNIFSHNIVNYDETRVQVGHDSEFVIESRCKKMPLKTGRKMVSVCTYLPFVQADGNVFMSFYIFPTKFNKTKKVKEATCFSYGESESVKPSWPVHYAFTKSSYMTKTLFKRVVATFTQRWREKYGDEPAFLIGDQAPCHKDDEIAKEALINNVHLLFLPPNTTHFLQPLDNVPFAHFKRFFQGQQKTFLSSKPFKPQQQLRSWMGEVHKAECESFRSKEIIHAFRETGIEPFDPEKIRQRAKAFTKPEVPQRSERDDMILKHLEEFMERTMSQEQANPELAKRCKLQVEDDSCFSQEELDEWLASSPEIKEKKKSLKRKRSTVDRDHDAAKEPPAKRQRTTKKIKQKRVKKGVKKGR